VLRIPPAFELSSDTAPDITEPKISAKGEESFAGVELFFEVIAKP